MSTTETLAKYAQHSPSTPADPGPDQHPLRSVAIEQIERTRRLKLRTATFVLGMLVLTPVWLVTQYLHAGGWPERLSDNGNPGDWNPWIIWVALAWGFYLVVNALAIYFRRPTDDAEIEREMERLTTR